MTSLMAGTVPVHIHPDERVMGNAAADTVIKAGLAARARANDVVLWTMAAPSAFSFYDALVARAGADPEVADLLGAARFYQFDDYPISRSSDRFPVTFRHLLETRLFEPLRRAIGGIGEVCALDLVGEAAADAELMARYAAALSAELNDPNTTVIEIKGIGMDGHWGFHGAETPLNDPAAFRRVPMKSANIHQQMIDWPAFFPTRESVPEYAVTANIELFLKADLIVDIVPQAEKEYAVLACYGTEAVHPAIPSSAIKTHPHALSHVTAAAARSLIAVRNGDAPRLDPDTVIRLEALWDSEDDRAMMNAVLADLSLI